LQQETIFYILWYFQLRGRKNLRNLTRDTFGFTVDANGQEYCFIQRNLLHKSVKASLSAKEFSDMKQARMYENTCVERYPVKSLKSYINYPSPQTKDVLFFLITNTGKLSNLAVVGKNTLGNLLKNLSSQLALSKNYVNHCLRVLGINVMHESRISNEAIAAVTGHKSSASVQRYVRTSDQQLQTASRCLSDVSCTASKNEMSEVAPQMQTVLNNISK